LSPDQHLQLAVRGIGVVNGGTGLVLVNVIDCGAGTLGFGLQEAAGRDGQS
jgi:hypothetical protein